MQEFIYIFGIGTILFYAGCFLVVMVYYLMQPENEKPVERLNENEIRAALKSRTDAAIEKDLRERVMKNENMAQEIPKPQLPPTESFHTPKSTFQIKAEARKRKGAK